MSALYGDTNWLLILSFYCQLCAIYTKPRHKISNKLTKKSTKLMKTEVYVRFFTIFSKASAWFKIKSKQPLLVKLLKNLSSIKNTPNNYFASSFYFFLHFWEPKGSKKDHDGKNVWITKGFLLLNSFSQQLVFLRLLGWATNTKKNSTERAFILSKGK